MQPPSSHPFHTWDVAEYQWESNLARLEKPALRHWLAWDLAAAGALQDRAQASPGGCTRVIWCMVPWSDGDACAPLLHPTFAFAHMHGNEIYNFWPCGTARKIAKVLPSASEPESAADGHLFPCVHVRPRLSQSLPAFPLSLWEQYAQQWLGPCKERALSQPSCKFSKGVILCVMTEK